MNINMLMQQATKMQKDLEKKLAEFEQKKFEYDYKNGSIVVIIDGKCNIISININKILIDPEDKEMLEQMVAEACNAAINGVLSDKKIIENSIKNNLM